MSFRISEPIQFHKCDDDKKQDSTYFQFKVSAPRATETS